MKQTSKLTRAQLRDLNAELEAERRRLERSMPELSRDADPTPVLDPTSADGGVVVALQSRAHARHAAIVAALMRLAEGTYGTCAVCGEGIPFGRLLAVPETAYCISCGARA
ncbi:MAG: TraR/DksA family transcriptional regulator [Gemmatimonadaceae bacterium]